MGKIKIHNIIKGSIADSLGIKPGDFLVDIGGEKIRDIFDYKYYMTGEYIEIGIENDSGETWIFDIEKDEQEDIGLEFESWLIDDAKQCGNKCLFCFIDQLPKGMRKSLYFKDDDARLSFLTGNYITLTNLTPGELDRIIKYRFSPINISVHTMDPDLRVKMLKNKNAGDSFNILDKLFDSGIEMNFQIVLVKGVNDGEYLNDSIMRLSKYLPLAKSVSVVPVGLTKHRDGLYPICPFNRVDCLQVLNQIHVFQQKFVRQYKTRFVYAADEFYISAGASLPEYKHYEDFPQLENGVGMMRLFLKEISGSLSRRRQKTCKKRLISVITGEAAYPFIKEACGQITEKLSGLNINVYPIKNNFFGENITVSGLLTGRDIIVQLEGASLGEKVLLPENALKSGEEVLLDDITVERLSKELNTDVVAVGANGRKFVSEMWRNN